MTKITNENAANRYRKATRMMRVLNLFIAIKFFYITFPMIQNTLGNKNGLGTAFIIAFSVTTIGIILFTFIHLEIHQHNIITFKMQIINILSIYFSSTKEKIKESNVDWSEHFHT